MASNSRSKGHGGGEICRHVFSRAEGIVVKSIFLDLMAASIIQTSRIGKEVGVSRKDEGSISISPSVGKGMQQFYSKKYPLIALYRYSDAIRIMNEQGM